MREFLLNLISFNIVDLFVEINHPLALVSNQMDPDHRGLVCKNGKFTPRDIRSAGLLHEFM